MADLSPAALAVMTAGTIGNSNVINDPVYRQCIAAAIRAAADQVVPREAAKDRDWVSDAYKQRMDTRSQLLAIASELKSHG